MNKILDKIGAKITSGVGSMYCAILFAILAFTGLPQNGTIYQYIQWTSTTFLQLVLLSIIMVGQKVQGQASEERMEKMLDHISKECDRILSDLEPKNGKRKGHH
jgi:hypothetical protein